MRIQHYVYQPPFFAAPKVPQEGAKGGKDFCGVEEAGAEPTLARHAHQGNNLNMALNEGDGVFK